MMTYCHIANSSVDNLTFHLTALIVLQDGCVQGPDLLHSLLLDSSLMGVPLQSLHSMQIRYSTFVQQIFIEQSNYQNQHHHGVRKSNSQHVFQEISFIKIVVRATNTTTKYHPYMLTVVIIAEIIRWAEVLQTQNLCWYYAHRIDCIANALSVS